MVRALFTSALIALAGLGVDGAPLPTPTAMPSLKGIIRENTVGGKLMAKIPIRGCTRHAAIRPNKHHRIENDRAISS